MCRPMLACSPTVLAALVAAAPRAQDPRPPAAATALTYPQLLERLTDPGWLAQPPRPGERGVQFSSYDRKSERGAEHFDDWYANNDRGQYLRVEQRDGRAEYVMVDAEGPGVVARIWSANPSGELYFDVDGERVWTVDFKALCSGELDGVPAPLAGVRARGHNCYLPIPFAKSLTVSASKNDFYYQVNVWSPGAGVTVPSFAPALLDRYGEAIAATAAQLPDGAPKSAWGAEWPSGADVPADSVVRALEVRVAQRPAGVDLGEALRRVLLVVRCGRHETIRVPVLDFFVGGSQWRPWRGQWLGIRDDGTGYCYLPMPMPRGGSIELVADGDLQGVELSLWASIAGDVEDDDALCLHAAFHSRKGFDSRPFHDHLVLDTTGPGRFVGCSLLVKNPHRGWWGEGDEKFWVDGEDFPSTFGTGTEDYFGYAWCDTQVFSAPQHAQPQCDGPGNRGHTADVRLHALDAVPFHHSFRFDLEAWHWVEGLKMDYATVAFWYAPAAASSGLPAVPPAAERALDRLPPPRVLVVDGAIEGEALRVVSVGSGTHEVQGMDFVEERFSRDAQRWWRDGRTGDALVLALPVRKAGRYRVQAAFCKADDYGIVQCALGGRELGRPIDLYATRVEPSGPIDLGEIDLPQGEVELALRLVGRNPRAKPRHMVGLDYVRLDEVK